MAPRLIAVVGATATGKSNLAIELAKSLGSAEIINADAMQLYRGMDIGTAKLSEAELDGIPHHLLSVVDPEKDLTAVEYRDMFDKALADITSRGKSAVVVGGSTLYLAAALDNLSFAPTDEELREKLEEEAVSIGALSMHEKLAKLDPEAAEKIPASNRRRVIRAIEVITLSGKNYAANFPEPSYRIPTIQLAVDVPRAVLNERIRQRVERMWDAGLLAEVAELKRQRLSRTARVAIGYRQALAQLEGQLSQAEAIAETQLLTTRYAKKQGTWFRRDKRIHWLDSSSELLPQALSVVRLER